MIKQDYIMRILLLTIFLAGAVLFPAIGQNTKDYFNGKTTHETLPGGIDVLKRDSNGSGKPDYELHTTSRGLKVYEALDTNDDGIMDTFYYYDPQGRLIRQEIDSDYDGEIDIKITLRDGTYIAGIWKDPKVHGNGQPKPQTPSSLS
jgi:hypothetical protein